MRRVKAFLGTFSSLPAPGNLPNRRTRDLLSTQQYEYSTVASPCPG